MNPLPSTAKTQFIKRAQFLAKDSGDAPHPRISVSLICKFLYLRLTMFSPVRSVHFTGIGGTAMASVAAAMQDKGFAVTGSDQNVYPPMSTFLAGKQIEVINGYAERNLAHKPDLVVIGNAISRGNPEAEFVLDHKLRYCSLPELLRGFFIRGKRSIVVAGTHGKTTTTALLAWVFEHNGLNPSYLIGGIPNNLSQGARFTDSDESRAGSEWFIIEGDEYDTAFFDKRSKFIHYQPEIAIVNNLEFDHADIFENLDAIKKTFSHFIRIIPRNGLLLGNGDDANLAPLLNVTHCPVKRFGLGEDNAVQAFNIRYGPTASEFEIPSFKFHLNLIGEFNVRNALAVVACAKHCGLKNHQIQSAFETFKGVKRRMEVRGIAGGVTLIDDFGHHPTAIRETLAALRVKYPGAVRAALEHDAAQRVSNRPGGRVWPRGRRGRLAGGAAGTDRARRAAQSRKIDAGFEGIGPGRHVSAGRGFNRRARCEERSGRRRRRGVQQRRLRRDSREAAGAAGAKVILGGRAEIAIVEGDPAKTL
jgi:UDP-N-acetylmuramate: L-alanyl-gamma-D-glutamyl-meso-diaminopimelate ligase